MAILETLARDHRVLEDILTELAETNTQEGARRTEIFTRLQALLQAHARAEEEVVYRRARAKLKEEALPLEAYEEHHVADILLQELASACPGGKGWTAKVMVLGELVRHHIKEEEVDLFAMIRANFDEAELARMDEEFRGLKHEAVEALLAPIRRATPAFAGRAAITAQAAAGRLARRGELYLRRTVGRLRGRPAFSAKPQENEEPSRPADLVIPKPTRKRKASASEGAAMH